MSAHATAETAARNATRLRMVLPARTDVEAEITRAVRLAIGDGKAEVSYRLTHEEGDYVIVVKQATGTWWAPLPPSLTQLFSNFDGRFILRWRDDEPPAAVES